MSQVTNLRRHSFPQRFKGRFFKFRTMWMTKTVFTRTNLPLPAAVLTDVVEGAAGGWRDLQEAGVDERGEGGGGLVFLHVVAGLALRRHGARLEGRRARGRGLHRRSAGRHGSKRAGRTDDAHHACAMGTQREK